MEEKQLTFSQRHAQKFNGALIEMISMALFAYGIVCSEGKDGKIALAFFGSLALCAPISGGHINPAVTLAMWLTRQISTGTCLLYWIAQLIGAFGGGFFCYMVLGQINSPMVTDLNFHWIIADLCGEALGSFSFILMILIQCNPKTTFSDKPIASIILITLSLHLSRCYTSHSGGCLNPGMAVALELFQVLKTNEVERLDSMWVFIAGPFAGAIVAVIFFKLIYQPAFNRYYKNA
ncbi:unnamed protein product [Paramecium octaurelia]|uniref:Aquaporin n=1 Tax=Paramecium octaurelia TaxID=43137 RepID=A0A8S1U310_PAROT|nr:unnamed protein product [Paramecium octaurelia]